MWPDLVIVSSPILQLHLRVVKAHELVRVQTFCAQLAVEGLDEAVVGRLAGREKSRMTSR